MNLIQLAAQTQVIRIVAMVTDKVGGESARLNAQRDATLELGEPAISYVKPQ
jgi:hypothetical protein